MRVSYSWLSTMVDLPQDPKDLAKELVRTGTEVEKIETLGQALDHVVTGQVLKKEPHPNADTLWLCQVSVGEKNLGQDGKPEALQIICGAQNFKQGDKIVVSLPGAVLPGGVKIKKSKLRGLISCGMNCSERELGLGNEHDGIMILPPETPVGIPFSEYWGLSDTVLDCEITPNRPDCLSMHGIAREVSAVLKKPLHIEVPAIVSESSQKTADLVDLSLEDPQLCGRYVCRVLKNVELKESPDWLKERLSAAGTRSINSVVDITNYVMYLTGQPLHAFDFDKIAGQDKKAHIVVRAARSGEELLTLDEVKRELTPDMIVISDNDDKALALAGIMGGLDSSVDENTKTVLLESAYFDPAHISRSSRNLHLISESSLRFERQVDRASCDEAIDIAAALFESCCSASVCAGKLDQYPSPLEIEPIHLNFAWVQKLCGAPISSEEMTNILARLGCACVKSRMGDDLEVVVPTNRPDLARPIDLVEEILRLWGMDLVSPRIPAAKNHTGGLSGKQRLVRKIHRLLRSQGLSEISSYCFADPSDLDKLGLSTQKTLSDKLAVELINPLLKDQSEMRRSLVPGLLRALSYNQAHGNTELSLYEIGRLFFGQENKSLPLEPVYIGAAITGARAKKQWNTDAKVRDFFDLKGMLEELLDGLHLERLRFVPVKEGDFPYLHPKRAATISAGKNCLGWIGSIHPSVAQKFDVSGEVLMFSLELEAILRSIAPSIHYKEISEFPAIEQDLALVVDEKLSSEELLQRLQSAGGKLLVETRLFDVYRNEKQLGANKKSMAVALKYQALDRTLTSAEVEKIHSKLVAKICRSCQAELRA